MEPVNLFDYEALAKSHMPHNLWDFVAGGAGDELAVKRNRSAFEAIAVNPRFLVDVGNRDLSTTVLGQRVSIPIMAAPAGCQSEVHPEGERAVARAAGAAGTVMGVANSSGYSIEEVAEVASGPLWFQLTHYTDEVTELLVTRAKAAGYSAICLTIDTPSSSPKDRDVRNQHVRARELNWGSLRDRPDLLAGIDVQEVDRTVWSPGPYTGLTWDRLESVRALTGLPLVVKGIRTVEDAVLCAEHGADGIIVSNHGGRQLDGTLSSIETLPGIADAVGDRLEVYLDSGVRRGLDVFRAIALGARAVLIGRPVFWGLAVGGEAGVQHVLDILRIEFDRAMAFCGRKSVAEIGRSSVTLPCNCNGWGQARG